MDAEWYQYVPHALASEYIALGWTDRGDAPGHHAQWSRIMRWEGSGAPPIPRESEDSPSR